MGWRCARSRRGFTSCSPQPLNPAKKARAAREVFRQVFRGANEPLKTKSPERGQEARRARTRHEHPSLHTLTLWLFLSWLLFGAILGIAFDSCFEWTFHRYVMHRPLGGFDYPFRRHALVHHHIFKADASYHLLRRQDQRTVPMAWWNGPALIVLTQIPFTGLALFAGGLPLVCGSFLATALYYAAYEYMHWCMHIPRNRKVERNGIFFRLNGHHLLHHRYMNKNFNVVLPLADLCFGTLLLRSKISFAQPRGPAVPDVQPLAA